MTVDRVWYILGKKLNNEASDQELEELAEILSLHPELHYPIQNISDLWKLDKQNDKQEAIDALQMHLLRLADSQGEIALPDDYQSPPPKHPLLYRNRYIAYMVVAVSVIAVFYYFLPYRGARQESMTSINTPGADIKVNEISTKTGTHSNIILPDGSKVWLNGGSRLTYDKAFNHSTREVELIGEAYFDVARNEGKPFIIHTRQMDIKVLGTVFNVKAYPEDDNSETSLIHGTVEVIMRHSSGERIILKPNDKLTINHSLNKSDKGEKATDVNMVSVTKIGSISYLPSDSTIIETSWVDNRLIFRDKSFAELSVAMERKYGVTFLFEHESIKQQMFNGNLKNESIEQALKALQLANKFSYQLMKDTIIISR